MSRPVRVSAVIVTWNGRDLLERLLQSLQKIDWPDLRVIVVDNAGTDGTAGMLADKFPYVEVLRMERNIGYSAGINAGLDHVGKKAPDYVWVFNNDVVVEPDSLTKLVEVMEADEGIGVAGPLVLDHATGQVAHTGYRINLWTGWMTEEPAPTGGDPYEVDSAFGCSNLIRWKVVEQVDGFDADYNVYFDETDFNTRTRRAGWKVVVAPSARVFHEESATMNRFIGRKAWLLLRNLMRFELKHASAAQLAFFIPYFFLLHVPQFVIRGLWYAYKMRGSGR